MAPRHQSCTTALLRGLALWVGTAAACSAGDCAPSDVGAVQTATLEEAMALRLLQVSPTGPLQPEEPRDEPRSGLMHAEVSASGDVATKEAIEGVRLLAVEGAAEAPERLDDDDMEPWLRHQLLLAQMTEAEAVLALLGHGVNGSRPNPFGACLGVASGFGDCLKGLLWFLPSSIKAQANYIIDSKCSTLENCLNSVASGLTSVLTAFLNLIKSGLSAAMNAIEAGIKKVAGKFDEWYRVVSTHAQQLWRDVVSYFNTIISKIQAFFNSVPAFKKYNLGDVCTKSGGFWGAAPTDCGTFTDLKSVFTDIFNAGRHFRNTLSDLKTCVSKKGLFGVPTPFFTLTFTPVCLPQWIVTPLEYIIGAIQYGAALAEELIKAAKSAYDKVGAFVSSKMSLFQLGHETSVRHGRHGRHDDSHGAQSNHSFEQGQTPSWYKEQTCQGEPNWSISLFFIGKLTLGVPIFAAWTPGEVSGSLGIGVMTGCQKSIWMPISLAVQLQFGVKPPLKILGAQPKASGAGVASLFSWNLGVGPQLSFSLNWPTVYNNRVIIDTKMEVTTEVGITKGTTSIKGGLPLGFSFGSLQGDAGYSNGFASAGETYSPDNAASSLVGFQVALMAVVDQDASAKALAKKAAESASLFTAEIAVTAGVSFTFCLWPCFGW